MKLAKIEIIIANTYLESLVRELERLEVKGYTAVEVSRGKGIKHGEHLSEGLLPVTRSSKVFCLVSFEKCEELFKELRTFLEERSSIMLCYEIHKSLGVSV